MNILAEYLNQVLFLSTFCPTDLRTKFTKCFNLVCELSKVASEKLAFAFGSNARYSGVPNKRGGENNRGGWKWFHITVIGGVGIIGGEVLEK